MCATGHVYAWLIDPLVAANFCPKCGEPIILACPSCNSPLPADGEMLQWVPYDGNCGNCGKAYPWKAGEIARAKRTLAEQAEAEGWIDQVKERADALVDDIAADRAAPSAVVAALDWLAHHGGESATATILDTVERLATAALKQALRPSFPGLF